MSENVRKLVGVVAMAVLVVVGVVVSSGDDDFTRNGVFIKLGDFRQLPEVIKSTGAFDVAAFTKLPEVEQARLAPKFLQQAAPRSLDTGPINKINKEGGPITKGAKASLTPAEHQDAVSTGKASVLEGRGVDGKGGTSSFAHAGTASPSYPVLSGRKAGIWLQNGGTEGVAERIEKWNGCSAADNLTVNSLKNVLVASYMENTKDPHSWGCAGDITWAIKESEQLNQKSEQLTNFDQKTNQFRVGEDEAGLLAACMESRVGDVLLKSHTEAMAADCVATVMPAMSPKRAKQLGTYWQTPEQLSVWTNGNATSVWTNEE
jgi:hypothetical protein